MFSVGQFYSGLKQYWVLKNVKGYVGVSVSLQVREADRWYVCQCFKL